MRGKASLPATSSPTPYSPPQPPPAPHLQRLPRPRCVLGDDHVDPAPDTCQFRVIQISPDALQQLVVASGEGEGQLRRELQRVLQTDDGADGVTRRLRCVDLGLERKG